MEQTVKLEYSDCHTEQSYDRKFMSTASAVLRIGLHSRGAILQKFWTGLIPATEGADAEVLPLCLPCRHVTRLGVLSIHHKVAQRLLSCPNLHLCK